MEVNEKNQTELLSYAYDSIEEVLRDLKIDRMLFYMFECILAGYDLLPEGEDELYGLFLRMNQGFSDHLTELYKACDQIRCIYLKAAHREK